jgi:uncharacterized protein GlcG (DUF336 family)
MNRAIKVPLILAATAFGASAVSAQTLPTHRIPAALATEAASEAVTSCAKGGYAETVVVVDADGATIAAVRGDGAGIHTLDSAHDKAYTSVTFKNDTMILADRAKGDGPIAPLAKLPHILFFPGGVVIKLNDEWVSRAEPETASRPRSAATESPAAGRTPHRSTPPRWPPSG